MLLKVIAACALALASGASADNPYNTFSTLVRNRTRGRACNFQQDEVLVEFAQCGGRNFDEDALMNCGQGFNCVFINEFFSQCRRRNTGINQIEPFGQCGGGDFNPDDPTDERPGPRNGRRRRCPLRQECRVQVRANGDINPFFSQCVPCVPIINMEPMGPV